MPIHKLALIARKEIARNTYVLDFAKPDGFHFIPGQYGGFTHIDPIETDANGMTRRFSILSIPQDENISIATRMQNSAYKRVLKELPIGREMKFAGPTGNFTLHTDLHIPAVLIAGGIGITPFYSMIRHACATHSKQEIILFYGNQSEQDSAFLNELSLLQKQNPQLKCVFAMAQPSTAWQGETGFIDSSMIKKHIDDLSKPTFYVCGSPTMVGALRETLDELAIPAERIKVEDFPGY